MTRVPGRSRETPSSPNRLQPLSSAVRSATRNEALIKVETQPRAAYIGSTALHLSGDFQVGQCKK